MLQPKLPSAPAREEDVSDVSEVSAGRRAIVRLAVGLVMAGAALAARTTSAQPSGEDRLKHRWERLLHSAPPRRTPFTEGVGVYDPFHRQFLVHEGSATSIAALSVDDGLWRDVPISPVGPAFRSSHAGVFDPVRRALILFGGTGGFEGRLNDVWAFDTRRRTWTRLDDPAQPDRPVIRSNMSLVLDARRDRLILYGGITGAGLAPTTLGDVWEFDLARRRWREIVAPGPRPRLAHAALYDKNRDRMLVYGGQSFTDRTAENLSDLWAFDCASETWSEIPSVGPDAPPALLESTFVSDDGQRAFLLGGSSGTIPTTLYADLRVLDLLTDTWRKLPDLNDHGTGQPGGGPGGGPGQPPRTTLTTLPPIDHHVAAYVPGDIRSIDASERRGRIFVFGGEIQKPDHSLEFRVDTWIYRRPTRLFSR